MDTAVKMPVSERINVRLLGFAAVVLLLIGYPVYIFVDSKISGGVWKQGDGSFYADLQLISSFDMDPRTATDTQIPAKYRALDGQKILLEGEMYEVNVAQGRIHRFDLVYSVSKCCVGPSPKIQHFVKCTVMPGRHVEYHANAKVRVFGIFHVGIVREPDTGLIASVYRLDVERVEAAD